MARFMAIGTMPGMTDAKFKDALDAFRKWRPDRQTFVVKAYFSQDAGKVVAECETVEKVRFEEWLKQAGWKVDGVYQVNLIHEAGQFWPV